MRIFSRKTQFLTQKQAVVLREQERLVSTCLSTLAGVRVNRPNQVEAAQQSARKRWNKLRAKLTQVVEKTSRARKRWRTLKAELTQVAEKVRRRTTKVSTAQLEVTRNETTRRRDNTKSKPDHKKTRRYSSEERTQPLLRTLEWNYMSGWKKSETSTRQMWRSDGRKE